MREFIFSKSSLYFLVVDVKDTRVKDVKRKKNQPKGSTHDEVRTRIALTVKKVGDPMVVVWGVSFRKPRT